MLQNSRHKKIRKYRMASKLITALKLLVSCLHKRRTFTIFLQLSTPVTSYSNASLTVFISRLVWFTRWFALRNTYCFLYRYTTQRNYQQVNVNNKVLSPTYSGQQSIDILRFLSHHPDTSLNQFFNKLLTDVKFV